MTQDAAQLGLEARASQDVYGSGPQTFPYVSFFPEPAGGGGSTVPGKRKRSHLFENFGFDESNVSERVRINGGTLYCGTKKVEVGNGLSVDSRSHVYLNVHVYQNGEFSASLSTSANSGDLSILLYYVGDEYIWDYVSGTMFVPYYN